MPVVPPYNADDAQVPYLRWVQEEILSLKQENARRAQNENNTNRGQSGTIDALQVQVRDLDAQQVQLAGAYQAAATAEDLASVAAAARISPYSTSSGATGVVLTTGGVTAVNQSIPVPDGFTRAIVVALGTIYALSSSTSDGMVGLVQINGNSGQQAPNSVVSGAGMVAPSHAQTLSGLTPGGSFNVNIQARLLIGPGTGSGNATLTTMALFLP